MVKAFVTGWPISHSKSPLLHGYWLEKYGISGSYEAIAVEVENFETFISSFGEAGFAGGNITIPHKEKAFELIEGCDEAALAIGAVNTVWLEEGKTKAGNTDAYGFSANLDQHAPRWSELKVATVLGAGGASRAIIYSLKQAGFDEIRIVNRTFSRAENLANEFGSPTTAYSWDKLPGLVGDTDLLVNTTSIGMSGTEETPMPDVSSMKKTSIVTDIVYTPLVTPLLAQAEKAGLETVDGLGMLLHQAVPGFEKWFGIRPDVTSELRERILGAS